jgi:hypothetical protein
MKLIFTMLLSVTLSGIFAQCPDLNITQAGILNLEPNYIRYGINLENIGTKDTKLDWSSTTDLDNVVIHSYLSNDALINFGDKKLQDIILGLSPLNEIKAGEVFSIVNRDTLNTAGYLYLILQIDTHGNIIECSNENNITILPLRRKQLILETGNVEGPKGTSMEIPVYASDFYNILGFQFSLSFSKPTIFRVDSIGNIGLNELNKGDITVKSDNKLNAIWISGQQNGLSFNGKRKLFSIFVTLTGEPGACTDIRFDDSLLPIEFISSSPLGDPIKAQTINGQLCIQNLVECSGRVTLSNNNPIVNALIRANQSSAITDYNGRYSIKDLTPGINYTLSASKTDTYTNGLSVIDIVLIKKHLLQIQSLPTPYELIAADVNGDLTISVQDMVLIRDLILGFIPNFGKTPVWQFIPKNYKFKNPLNPFLELYPISYSLPNINSNKANLDFIGIKTGDVSLDWSERYAPSLETRAANYFTLTVKEEMLEANKIYSIPIYTRQFNKINGFQFAIKFDPSIKFENISTTSLKDFSAKNFNQYDDKLNVLWYDSKSEGNFIADTGVLFILKVKTSKSMNTKSIFEIDRNSIVPQGIHEQGWYYSIRTESIKALLSPNTDKSTVDLKVYPNPVTDLLHISFNLDDFDSKAKLKVIDPYGRTIYESSPFTSTGTHQVGPSWHPLTLNRHFLLKYM